MIEYVAYVAYNPTAPMPDHCMGKKEYICNSNTPTIITFRGSIVVSIPACHAGDPGSIPGSGVSFFIYFLYIFLYIFYTKKKSIRNTKKKKKRIDNDEI